MQAKRRGMTEPEAGCVTAGHTRVPFSRPLCRRNQAAFSDTPGDVSTTVNVQSTPNVRLEHHRPALGLPERRSGRLRVPVSMSTQYSAVSRVPWMRRPGPCCGKLWTSVVETPTRAAGQSFPQRSQIPAS
jgi:hypothetical protein